MKLLGAVWSNNALSTLRVPPNPAYPSRNSLSPFGLSESVLKPLFSGSHWVSRTSACENCCCDFLLSIGHDRQMPEALTGKRGPPRSRRCQTCFWRPRPDGKHKSTFHKQCYACIDVASFHIPHAII